MAFPGFAYLLILLLASVPLRDLFPADAVSPLQSIGADEDDISLPTPRQGQGVRVPGLGAPAAAARSASARVPLLPPAACASAAQRPAHPVSCLYLFMAILR